MRSTHFQRRFNDYLALLERDPLTKQRIAHSVDAFTAQAKLLQEATKGLRAAEGQVMELAVQAEFAEEEAPLAKAGAR